MDRLAEMIPGEVRWAVYKRDGYACVECGADADLTIDHKVPTRAGGTDDGDNLQTLCRPCNASKGGTQVRPRPPVERQQRQKMAPRSERKDVLITIRVTPELRDAMNAYAEKKGRSVADLLRGAMLKAVDGAAG